MQQPATKQQLALHPSVPDKRTEVSQPRQSTISTMGKRLPKYTQKYDSSTIITGEIMTMNTRISRRTEIFAKAEVFDPYTMYIHQVMKENDATQF